MFMEAVRAHPHVNAGCVNMFQLMVGGGGGGGEKGAP